MHGNYYGTSADYVDNIIKKGKVELLVVRFVCLILIFKVLRRFMQNMRIGIIFLWFLHLLNSCS